MDPTSFRNGPAECYGRIYNRHGVALFSLAIAEQAGKAKVANTHRATLAKAGFDERTIAVALDWAVRWYGTKLTAKLSECRSLAAEYKAQELANKARKVA